MLPIEMFIAKYVTGRSESMFLLDIQNSEEKLTRQIGGKRVLVIGGAGSIGSSYIHAILAYHPGQLVVVDINENSLAELTRDLRSSDRVTVPNEYITYPMDYASETFQKMFEFNQGFDIVANFSAHKHVRSEKDIFSVEALLRNNVLHAKKLLELLKKYPPEVYFCVSTDKAANPVNIMGASKRIMEDLIFSYSDSFPVKTARFANVAFSNGSLPAGFLARIGKLQPLSAPSDVRRYFVSPEESGQICMLSSIMGNNREIFFPKLGEEKMIGFDVIAENLLKEYGYQVLYCSSDDEAIKKAKALRNGSREYPVHFSGSDTSGEKPFEEFVTETETADLARFSSLGVITGKKIPDRRRLDDLLMSLEEEFASGTTSKSRIVERISAYLPEFGHIETGKSLDSKM